MSGNREKSRKTFRGRIHRTLSMEENVKKRILLLAVLIVTVFTVYSSTKAQRKNGLEVRLRIQKVTEDGVLPRTLQGEPEVMGFSCATTLADKEPTCYVLLRDRAF